MDEWMETTDRIGDVMDQVSRRADVTIQQVRSSEDAHNVYERIMMPHKNMLDVYCAAQIDGKMIPKKARKNMHGYIRRFAHTNVHDTDMQQTFDMVGKLRDEYHFFHWELEMMDAFTDARYGFDLIVGNPPWDKVKPYDDEFFTRHYPTFRSINTKPKKKIKQDEILKNSAIQADYDRYRKSFRDKSMFYKTYTMQGVGDWDLWQLILERMLGLVSEGGVISVLVPSQILSNTGSALMRKRILNTDIRQMYVFENSKKIFPIDSRYRFLLLTVRNADGPDTFKAGFYLHNLASLNTDRSEPDKFHNISKKVICKMSPDTLRIPEIGGVYLDILSKMSECDTLGFESRDGWSVALSSGFHRGNDANLLKEKGRGWPVLQGRHIHQFNHDFARPEFVASISDGLSREKRKRVFKDKSRLLYHSYRLAFRDISSPTNMRTIIAAIIPPQRFHTDSMRSIVLIRNRTFEDGNDYNRHTAYLCGIINSMPFDFVARSTARMNMATIIKSISVPSILHYDEIAKFAAMLSAGSDEFEGFAESMRIDNVRLSPHDRIHTTAKLDALVAHAYGLTRDEYQTILNSFKFTENHTLLEAESVDFNDNRTLRQFYGEVRKLAPQYYDDIQEAHP